MMKLEYAEGIQVQQRRRFWRAPVRESSTVNLKAVGATCEYRGTMLNVSPDGLACTVHRLDAEDLRVGEKLNVRFDLEGEKDPFWLAVELKGKTPAGSPTRMILRLQFVAATMPERDRLRIRRATCACAEPV